MAAAREPTVLDREIARRLRRAMGAADLNGKQIAPLLEHSEVRISRWLTGRDAISEVDAAAFLVVCGIGTKRQAPLLRLIRDRDHAVPLWLSGIELADGGYADHLSGAVSVREFACVGLPAMVQTPQYAHAAIGDAADTVEGDGWLAVREHATRLLHRSCLDVRVVVHEWVVRTPIGGTDVMADQLDHLVRLSTWGHVSVRVLPIDAHPVGMSPFGPAQFGVATVPDTRHVLYQHDTDGLLLRDNPTNVAYHRALFDRLHTTALNEEDTRALLVAIAAEHAPMAVTR
jgi:hypothetical protein